MPELLAAPLTTIVYVAEGEKDVDALRQRLLVATCNPGGVGKWRQEYKTFFRARHVIVLSDNDAQAVDTEGKPRFHPDGRPVLPGQDHADDVTKNLRGIAASVRILMLPNLPPKGDVSDWFAAGGTAEELERLARDAPEQKQEPPPDPRRGLSRYDVGRQGGRAMADGFPNMGTTRELIQLPPLLSAGAPLISAREFIRRHHTDGDLRTLHHQNDTFYTWQQTHYTEATKEDMRARLYCFLDKATRPAEMA